MIQAIQRAFDNWWSKPDSRHIGREKWEMWDAFDCGYNAGYNAAIAQSVEPGIDKAGGAGSTPAGSTISAEDIYAAYPRKIARSAAIKAIQKAGKAVGMEKLLKAVKAYAEATSRWPAEERQYIPHPATWFNQGRYDDDPKEWERGGGGSQFSVTH
jgi:hypothetical protein